MVTHLDIMDPRVKHEDDEVDENDYGYRIEYGMTRWMKMIVLFYVESRDIECEKHYLLIT